MVSGTNPLCLLQFSRQFVYLILELHAIETIQIHMKETYGVIGLTYIYIDRDHYGISLTSPYFYERVQCVNVPI